MEGIDLDPASCEEANEIVGADRFFTARFDALRPQADWSARRVFMNPPYSPAKLAREFAERLCDEVECGAVTRAVVLTNNNTETAGGQLLLARCKAVCFPEGRVKFVRPGGSDRGGPLQGQMITAHGDFTCRTVLRFTETFNRFGQCFTVFT